MLLKARNVDDLLIYQVPHSMCDIDIKQSVHKLFINLQGSHLTGEVGHI